MKPIILFLCLMIFSPLAVDAQLFYRHKSEAQLSQMTPAQRVDEVAEEQVYHRYDFLDEQGRLIEKYIIRDGLTALPRIIEIMDEYDPTRASGRNGHKTERFDAARMMLGDIDNLAVRLRGSEEGRRAMEALERAMGRMSAAGYGPQKPGDEWTFVKNGRFELAMMALEQARGINLTTDKAIRDTFRLEYKIQVSDEELLAFSNFLVAHYPDYPSWSESDRIQDFTRVNAAGMPVMVRIMKKPERYYEAYQEFKKTKP